MIAALFNVPSTATDWNTWSYHHKLSHDAIRQALVAQRGIATTDYILDPIFQQDIIGFLQRNEQTHTEMNAALGLNGVDLQEADLRDERQRVAWVWIHAEEHLAAEMALGI